MKHLLSILVLTGSVQVLSQNKQIGVSILQGVNKTFIGGTTIVGHSSALGAAVLLKNKKGHIFFEPHVVVSKNSHNQSVSETMNLKVRKWGVCIMPLAGIMLNDNIAFKTGLFFITGHTTSVDAVFRQNGGYYSFSNQELYGNFSPNPIQAGAAVGISFALGKKKRSWFNILFQQFATPVVTEDYYVHLALSNGTSFLILEDTGRPSVLMAGFNFYFAKKKKEE